MPKLKEISDLVDADPSLGEQISVFKNDNSSGDISND